MIFLNIIRLGRTKRSMNVTIYYLYFRDKKYLIFLSLKKSRKTGKDLLIQLQKIMSREEDRNENNEVYY
jgi:hypothetical protein